MVSLIDRERRRLLSGGARTLAGTGAGGLVMLAGACASMPPMVAAGSTEAGIALYQRAAKAHGVDGFAKILDINVSYDGYWHDLVRRIQPVLTDAGYRRSSEERLMPVIGVYGQTYTGPAGIKQVLRRRNVIGEGDEIAVSKDGKRVNDLADLAASALVVDAARLFLLGPLAYDGSTAGFDVGEPIWIGDRRCDALLIAQRPGFGQRGEDKVILYIDQRTELMRRTRFTIEALESTRGAIVEVDTEAHIDRHGMRWPTRFFERLVRPMPNLPVHRWRMTGLDVNRGYGPAALGSADKPGFSGAAASPARALSG